MAGVERGATTSLQPMLALLHHEIQQATATIRQISADQRNKQGIHSVRGPMTVAEIVEALIVAHAESHLVQIQALIAG